MRLLLDQNLSRRLLAELAPIFADSAHVGALGLDPATDREIWAYAGEHGYLIVSKDSDFRSDPRPRRYGSGWGIAPRR